MGNPNAEQQLTEWVANYGDALFIFAFKRVNNRHLAKDLLQDTFLSAWNNMQNFKGEASVKTWLFTILKNKIIDHHRYQGKRKMVSEPQNHADAAYFDSDQHWQIGAYPKNWANSTQELFENKAFFNVLWQCKEKLKTVQNAVFTMKYIDGYNSEEICKALELTPSNYWMLIHRAKLQLRACLELNWMAA
jgi:RNA polymerase sigma-70 factor (TIGR02943 family)